MSYNISKFEFIPVVRIHGSNGDVSVTWKFTDGTPNGFTYNVRKAAINFDHGQNQQFFPLPLNNSFKSGGGSIIKVMFGIELHDPQGGAMLGKISKMNVTFFDTGKTSTTI